MSRGVLRFAWYRFRSTFGDRWTGYLSLVLLVGLVGGLAMGAVAAARRTQASFPAYLASTNASDLNFLPQPFAPSQAFSTTLSNELSHLPQVRSVESYSFLIVLPLGPHGVPTTTSAGAVNNNDVSIIGSVDGLFLNQDRVTVTEGRMADPKRADEFVATAEAVRLLGWHVGEVVPFGAYAATASQSGSSPFGLKPRIRINAKLTGIVVFNTAVVQDDVDRYPTYALFTPTLTRSLLLRKADYIGFAAYGLRLDQGSRDVSAVEREIIGLLPRRTFYQFRVTSVVEGQVERAIKPESIALGAFGLIAALAALVIVGQAIGRRLRTNSEDLAVLRAIGAAPALTIVDGLAGTLGAVVLGSILAGGVAIALSPLAPLGAVRQVDPSPGVAFDWTVLGIGLGVLSVGLGSLAMSIAYRGTPHRVARREARVPIRSSGVVRVAAASGLPTPAIAGLRFALDPGRGRSAVPVRSALFANTLAVLMVAATLTFGSSLATLVSHPALYGWNWDFELLQQGAALGVPPQTGALLSRDAVVSAWTGFNFANAQIDGQTVPIILSSNHAQLTPPILSGHALQGPYQIVLGPATLAQLNKRVGDGVMLSYGTPKDAPVYVPPTRLSIVGTVTMPAIGSPESLRTSMGTGALISQATEPPAFRKAITSPDPTLNGPTAMVVKLRSGVDPAAGLASLQRIADAANKALAADPSGQGAGTNIVVLRVQRPAEIVNYRSMGATPTVLAGGLALGAVVALGLTLTASVRRRRRDLALLKAFGFTKRQLFATVAWQASVAAVVGVVVGVPLGVAAGRWLWTLFAKNIYAVPEPTVPVLYLVLVALGALLFANVVAAVPGRIAARTPTALVLRAE